MKKYVFIMQGDEIFVTMDGSGSGFDDMIKAFEKAGYLAKIVTSKEYHQEKQRQEKMIWDKDEQLFGKRKEIER